MLAFQPSDLSDAVTDVKWSPHDSNIFGSVTSDGRILLWDVKRIDPSVSHDIESDFTASESEAIQEAEDDLTKRKERKINKEKEANDPLLMLAMSMKQQKGEASQARSMSPRQTTHGPRHKNVLVRHTFFIQCHWHDERDVVCV